MNIISRLRGSVRRRGVLPTVKVVQGDIVMHARRIWDRSFDLKHHTDTQHIVETPDMTDVESENTSLGHRNEATRPRPFRRLLRELDLPDGSVFVDLGCGDGRALILAAQAGIRRVVGIDYYPQACETARHNIETVRRSGVDIDSEVICGDVIDLEFAAEYNIFYLFNPFDSEMLDGVLDNLNSSLERSPRRVWIIYQYPESREVLDSRKEYSLLLHRTYGGCEFLVYSYAS
jgi:SAM-dependent methyltransferase